MIRKSILILLSLCMAWSFSAAAMAAETGNKRKGKYIYRKVYKACHQRGAVDTPKPHLNPDAKTQAEWTQVFDSKDFNAFGCEEEWIQLSAKDLTDIYTYLHAHAADSPTPLKCK